MEMPHPTILAAAGCWAVWAVGGAQAVALAGLRRFFDTDGAALTPVDMITEGLATSMSRPPSDCTVRGWASSAKQGQPRSLSSPITPPTRCLAAADLVSQAEHDELTASVGHSSEDWPMPPPTPNWLASCRLRCTANG